MGPVQVRLTAGALLSPALLLGSLAACGDGPSGDATSSKDPEVIRTATDLLPPGADRAEPSEDAAGEASPEAPAAGPEASELSEEDEAAVTEAVNSYIESLNERDAGAVCALHEPGSLPISELPIRRGDCPASLAASLGYSRPGGIPVWKSTTIDELEEVSVGPNRARVTASVTHQFADRKYPSVEDDVIYLDRFGDTWLLAKPSGTLYRAVGYPEPPLRALRPPPASP